MFHEGFDASLTPEMAEELRERANASRGSVLTATSVAGSGHPGGSMSSMELYTVLLLVRPTPTSRAPLVGS